MWNYHLSILDYLSQISFYMFPKILSMNNVIFVFLQDLVNFCFQLVNISLNVILILVTFRDPKNEVPYGGCRYFFLLWVTLVNILGSLNFFLKTKSRYTHLKMFVSSFASTLTNNKHKFDPMVRRCVFSRISLIVKGYKLLDMES